MLTLILVLAVVLTHLQPAEERALRVSLLARLPEVAVRAVAKEAGLPNWAWLDPRQDFALPLFTLSTRKCRSNWNFWKCF